jgi:exodeoxyribonuclease-3
MVRATVDGVDVIGVYVPNGNPMDSHKFPYKLDWLRRLREELDHGHDAATEVLLCGDMNIAPTEADVHDPFEAEGRVLYTPEEKAALKHIVDWGFTDAYRKKNPFSSEYTWWDYRGSAFRNNQGWRIDHIYLTRPLMRRCRKVRVDRVTRTWDKPSDHAPVVVTLRDR